MRQAATRQTAKLLLGVFMALLCICPLVCAQPVDAHSCCKHKQTQANNKPCDSAIVATKTPAIPQVPIAAALPGPVLEASLLPAASTQTPAPRLFDPPPPKRKLTLRI